MPLRPMLAEPIDVAKLPEFCENPTWFFEQKVDGHRRLIVIEDGRGAILNRSGEKTTLPGPVMVEMKRLSQSLPGRWALDGELIANSQLILFDLPLAGPTMVPAKDDGDPKPYGLTTAYEDRRLTLESLVESCGFGPTVRLLPCAKTHEDKAALAKRLFENNAEGVILKDRHAGYASGKRSLKCRKAKFTKDIDCVVIDANIGGKDNFAVACWEPGKAKPTPVGEVTALSKDGALIIAAFRAWEAAGKDPATQPVVVVKYLYAVEGKRKLVQPTYPRLRDDKPPNQCTIDQLVYTNKEVLP